MICVDKIKTGNEQLDTLGFGEFQKVSLIRNDFDFMDFNRTTKLLQFAEKLSNYNNCDVLIISISDFSNYKCTFPERSHQKIYFEQTSNIEKVFEKIRNRERKGIILVLDFDLYYSNLQNGDMVGDNKKTVRCYFDQLIEITSKSNVTVIVESQYDNRMAYKNMLLVNANGNDYVLFDDGNFIEWN